MTWRARAYLLVLTLRHFGVGLIALVAEEKFTSSSYDSIRAILPLEVWGALLTAVGIHAALAVVFDNETWARWVMVASAAMTGCWAAGFLLAGLRGQLDAPPLPITWAAFTLKDLIVSGMSLSLPFEEAARRRGYLQ